MITFPEPANTPKIEPLRSSISGNFSLKLMLYQATGEGCLTIRTFSLSD